MNQAIMDQGGDDGDETAGHCERPAVLYGNLGSLKEIRSSPTFRFWQHTMPSRLRPV